MGMSKMNFEQFYWATPHRKGGLVKFGFAMLRCGWVKYGFEGCGKNNESLKCFLVASEFPTFIYQGFCRHMMAWGFLWDLLGWHPTKVIGPNQICEIVLYYYIGTCNYYTQSRIISTMKKWSAFISMQEWDPVHQSFSAVALLCN